MERSSPFKGKYATETDFHIFESNLYIRVYITKMKGLVHTMTNFRIGNKS